MRKDQIVLRRLIIIAIILILISVTPSVLPHITERLPLSTDSWLTRIPLAPMLDAAAQALAALVLQIHLLRYAAIALLIAALGSALFQWRRGGDDVEPSDERNLLRVSKVLMQEAEATHGPCADAKLLDVIAAFPDVAAKQAGTTVANEPDFKNGVPPAMYRWLNQLDRVALCLSGGGIRSASFALGVVQALASYPGRAKSAAGTTSAAEPLAPDEAAPKSFLTQIDFLSTVSGGGYIGSWLSAWLQRDTFVNVWKGLVRLPNEATDPGDEPAPVQWLRDHSNYLTPQLGLTSPDTLTDVAIFLRNLILNWLILLPMLCAALLTIKLFELLLFFLSLHHSAVLFGWFAAAGFVLLFIALRFRLRNVGSGSKPSDRSKQLHSRKLADQGKFVKFGLVPSLLAAVAFTLCLALASVTQDVDGRYRSWVAALLDLIMHDGVFILPRILWLGAIFGTLIYALSWFASSSVWRRPGEFWRWAVSGTVYGIAVAALVYFFSRTHAIDWSFYTPLNWVCRLTGYFCGDEPDRGLNRHALALLYLGVPLLLFAQLLAEMIFVGLKSDPSDDQREWLGRAAGLQMLAGLGWMILVFLTCVGSDIAVRLFHNPYNWAIIFGVFAAGALAASIGRKGRPPAQDGPADPKSKPTNTALATVATICAISLVVVTSGLLDVIVLGEPIAGPIDNRNNLEQIRKSIDDMLLPVVQALVLAAFFGWVASKTINVNRFSMHALYRNRLVRTFLGASAKGRDPNPFTNFDPNDNPKMHTLWDPRSPGTTVGQLVSKVGGWRPLHIINIALNVTSSDKHLAWQERKAASFTVSPLHCGSAYTGYRSSAEYGDRDPKNKEKNGISLGTAMAISGAAASPNQGYNSSPAMAFLMALFNVRLGWWLGNPGREGAATYFDDGPRMAIRPLVAEMLGMTRDDQEYVYLSDGGHFENLGLYEMVRRRCGFIIVSDAGCDPNYAFEDLGNAVRKIQIDLGVRIKFIGLDRLRPRGSDAGSGAGPYHAVGEINYPAADGQGAKKGIILYIKPGYHGTESSPGIRSYAISDDQFPHDDTANQWFGESQLESYRALGFEIMDEILRDGMEGAVKAGTPRDQVTLRDVLMAHAKAATHHGNDAEDLR
jgi:hypothetical protein